MRLVTASTGKQALKLSKKDWEAMGRVAGWITEASLFDEIGHYKAFQSKILQKYRGRGFGLHTTDVQVLKYLAGEGDKDAIVDLQRSL